MISFFAADVTVPLKQRGLVKRWLSSLAEGRGLSIDRLHYIFCSDEYLLEMNKQYLQHDYYTDIITFPTLDQTDKISGECYISVDRVKDNASEIGVTFAQELRRVMAHGLLHLMGEDDKSVEDVKSMRQAEEDALLSWLFHVEQQATNK